MDKLGQQRISRPQHDLLYASHCYNGREFTQHNPCSILVPTAILPEQLTIGINWVSKSKFRNNDRLTNYVNPTKPAQECSHPINFFNRLRNKALDKFTLFSWVIPWSINNLAFSSKPAKNLGTVAIKRSLSYAGSTFPSNSLSTKHINGSIHQLLNTSGHFTITRNSSTANRNWKHGLV